MDEIKPEPRPVNNEPVIKPQRDRSKLWTWVLIALLFIAGVAGTWWWQQRTINGLKSKVSTLEQANQTSGDSANTTAEVVGKVKYVSVSGVYSLSYPSDWQSLVCEGNEATVFLAPDAESQARCASEKFSPVSFSSASGDQRSLNATSIDDYASEVSVTDVTIDGVTGKKATYTQDGNEFVAAGTKYVQYEFFTGGRTYNATYAQAPEATSYLADFETMVQSWKFSI